MRTILLLLIATLFACATQPSEVAGKKDSELAIIWIYDPSFVSQVYLKKIDGESVNFGFMSTKIKQLPGKKALEFGFPGAYKVDNSDDDFFIRFKFDLNLDAGYSYILRLEGVGLSVGSNPGLVSIRSVANDAQLCIFKEKHNATGAKINFTGEIRTMSKSAEKITCSPVFLINYNNENQPEA